MGKWEGVRLMGAIDQGTTSSRVILFTLDGEIASVHQLEHKQHFPHPGWVEHDAMEILSNVKRCLDAAAADVVGADVVAFGITNQRETLVVWDNDSGKPLCNAVVWMDTRTKKTCDKLAEGENGKDRLRDLCGLPISTYFSGVKLRWLIDNVPHVKQAVDAGTCCIGTIDTWLLWNLVRDESGNRVYATDITNASRTMLMNIHTRQWDDTLCGVMGISKEILPCIRSNAETYGTLCESAFRGVCLSASLGDQHAALLGHGCLTPGAAKNTYGTGCFLLLHTGEDACASTHGLLTTVAFQLGASGPCFYALEGSVAVAGAAVSWLRDGLELISSAGETEALASSVSDSGGVAFVPAFSGLFAPRWRSDARGVCVGITQYTKRAHIVRAVLESVAFQAADVVRAMQKDSGETLRSLHVDGGMTANALLLQLQADVLGVDVVRSEMPEVTALGAAFAAALAVGAMKSPEDIRRCNHDGTSFRSARDDGWRAERLSQWEDAVQRSLNLA